jgi:uncharacterized protein
MTKQQLKEELKQSMLARDTDKTSVLRMILSSIQSFEMKKDEEEYEKKLQEAGGDSNNLSVGETKSNYETSEEDVQDVIQKQAKQRRDSIEQFKVANRPELVEKETKELELLEGFLPKQMDEEEIKQLVDDAVEKTGATSASDMGKVMGVLMPQVKGKADGGLVSKLVKEKLNH